MLIDRTVPSTVKAPVPDLIFVHGNHFPRCVAVVDKYFPDYCSLQLMTAGAVDLSYDDEQHHLSGRWVWVCYPGPHIRFHRAAGAAYWVHRYVAFRGALVSRWAQAGLLSPVPQRVPARGDFVQRFDALLRMFPRTDTLGRLLTVNLLENLLLELADQRRPANVQWLDRAKDAILRLRRFRPDYASVAEELGMGLSTFRRAFRREAGISVHQFLLMRQVESARNLLAETQLPVKAIARQLEYRDVPFFSRQFSKATGMSPAAYRESVRGSGSRLTGVAEEPLV